MEIWGAAIGIGATAGSAVGGAALSAGTSALSGALAKSGSSKSTTARPAYLEDANKDALSRGQAIADRPYEAYDARQRVAGLGANEQAGMTQAAGLQGKYQPMLDRASQPFSSSVLSNYMNPYTKSVLDVNARRINEDYDAQLGSLNRKRGMMDAFGSSRGTQLELGLNSQRNKAMRDMETQGLSNAYDKGVAAFQQDRSAALDAAQAGSAVDRASIDSLMTTGAVDRTQRQATQDFDYGQFLEKRDWSMNNFESLLKGLHEANGGGGSTTTSQGPSGNVAGQLVGLAGTVAGAYLSNKEPGVDTGYIGGAANAEMDRIGTVPQQSVLG